MKTAILIPAYEPDIKLVKLVQELAEMPFPLILVVNDGSSELCMDIFDAVEKAPHCRVIHHEYNRGKGAALKTGMQVILNMDPDLLGCITVDADGQHLPEDIRKVAEEFERNSQSLVLGCRDFNQENVPAKSRYGNRITRTVFKLMTGQWVSDTQTGLRALPLRVMKTLGEIPGDRYEFEMNMLLQAAKQGIPLRETTIQTVYIDQNRASHFNPLLDSIRIYREILKFSFSSLLSSGIDLGLFSLIYWLFSANNIAGSLLGATVLARMFSSGVNFSLNKRMVFENKDLAMFQAVKYYFLCAIQMFCSWLMLEGFTRLGLTHVLLLKILADTTLFFISFTIQRLFVFGRNHHEKTA